MNEAPFTIGGAIREGWRLTKENIGFLIVYQIILYVILVLTGGTQEKWEWSLWHFLGWIILILGKMGLYNSTLLITSGIKPNFDQLYKNWRMFFSWVVASFLFGIMLVIGFALLIVPGCYLWARYGFYPFFILDKKSGPLEALSESAATTEGIRWPVFLLFLACAGLDVLGILFFGIGLLLTVPITLLALATVYRKITESRQNIIQPTEITSNH
jgi:uncharacterized membrane protein